MSSRTVHFPPNGSHRNVVVDPADCRKPDPEKTAAAPAPQVTVKNAFECYANAVSDCQVIAEKLRKLFASDNRHGDMQVIRSAALRIAEEAAHMIEIEENAVSTDQWALKQK